MQDVERYLDELDQDPVIRSIKTQLSSLEARIRPLVSDDAWMLLLHWEGLWVQYTQVCVERLYPRNGTDA
ncbi:hypothetical protein [Tumebacillus flagellatus]|uniref:Uncharacterized protein n=1 Tax=Tumebacillus flagellatus TaxID=1157490 RepID=A0A074LKK1_9BACL|nr:hypothetical protein [Tumebacillus flagellatus]KEO81609.1 hypothetical protein EL26_19735 [Tumebacillus flagellatus]